MAVLTVYVPFALTVPSVRTLKPRPATVVEKYMVPVGVKGVLNRMVLLSYVAGFRYKNPFILQS